MTSMPLVGATLRSLQLPEWVAFHASRIQHKLFPLPGMPFSSPKLLPHLHPSLCHSLSYLQLILGTLLHGRHFLLTRQVSTPPVCSHRNNYVQTFPWSPSFCTLIVCVLICLPFCALHSWIQRMHRHTLAFLEVWHTFLPVGTRKQQGLSRGGRQA